MPTHKHRINLTVPADLDQALHKLAKRDQLSLSSKALDLLRRAIEIEEDEALLLVAEEREKEKVKYLSHDQAWG